MSDLEYNLSDLIDFPISIRSIASSVSESTVEDVDIEFEIHCVPAPKKHDCDEEVPFCDMDCANCPVSDELDEDFDDYEPPFWGIPDIRKVIFNPPATIVFWDDDTKTVVKCMDGQPFERYAGFAAACMKKLFGSTSRAKAIMEECDEANWKAWAAEENEAKATPAPKKAESKPKTISVDELVNAFTDAIKAVVKGKAEVKENQNETPSE